MREPSLTTSPPMIAGSTLTSSSTVLPPVTDLSASLDRVEMLVGKLLGDRDLGAHLALVARDQVAECLDHVAHGEQPPVRRTRLQEFRGEPANAGLREHGGERLGLLVGAEHRTAHQPREIGARGDERVESFQIGLHRIDGLAFERKLEQRARVAACHAGYDRFFACHVSSLVFKAFASAGSAPSRTGGASPWNSSGTYDFGSEHGGPIPAKIARFP